ncbi:MAG: dienelactone hydrolase family protein, partial [Aquisalinus sp.]|nr:dienelactone hydrolase family protein [Aquisalinus sp.]
MCNDFTEQDNASFERAGGRLNRRDFSLLGTAAIFAAMYPGLAQAETAVTESDVEVTMTEGNSDCYFVHPAEGKHPAILMWPDIRGLRPAFKAMGKRLAMAGYSVLVVNPFYRDAKAPVVEPGASFRD